MYTCQQPKIAQRFLLSMTTAKDQIMTQLIFVLK